MIKEIVMKKFFAKALSLVAILGFTSMATLAKDYNDLPKDHWAYKQIQILTDLAKKRLNI